MPGPTVCDVADIGPRGAQPGELVRLVEGDEPARLAIVTRVVREPDGQTDGLPVVSLALDPWGYGEPGPDELERDLAGY